MNVFLCIYLVIRKVRWHQLQYNTIAVTKWLLQGIKPHVVNHGILTKLRCLIHLYSSFFFFYNSLTIKQVIPVRSTKSFIWNVIYIIYLLVMNTLFIHILLLNKKWLKTSKNYCILNGKKKTVLDLNIKHLLSVLGCEDKQFCGALTYI